MTLPAENIVVRQNGQRPVKPKLVMCNFFQETEKLGRFAHEYGFSGIDFSFNLKQFPKTPAQDSNVMD